MLFSNVLVEFKLSRIQRAIDSNKFERARRLAAALTKKKPQLPRAWLLQGLAAEQLRAPDDALNCYNRAIELNPQFGDALFRRGILAQDAGRIEAAIQDFYAANNANPEKPKVAGALSSALLRHNRPDLAEPILITALQTSPNAPELNCNLALVRLAQKRTDDAVLLLQRALQADPSHRFSRINLGHLLVDQERFDEATQVFNDGLSIKPDDADFATGLATLAYARRDFAAALDRFQRIAATHPKHFLARMYVGMSLRELRRYDEAMACFRELAADPAADATAHLNLSFMLLALEHYGEGWDEYESRRYTSETPGTVGTAPAWSGNALDGALLLYGEQGLGDEIMFASCVPDALAKTKDIVLQCDPRLSSLFQRSFPSVRVAGTERAQRDAALKTLPPIAAQLPIGSLPRLFRRRRSDFPEHHGYLRADDAKCNQWRARLDERGSGLRVGLCWRGGAQAANQAARSVDLSQWLEILGTRNTVFVSVQHGAIETELADLQRTREMTVHHFPGVTDDMDDLAALIGALDLVISVQSTTVHLAGALGRPCWALVPYSPEWRYLAQGETMLWYPSVKIVRQSDSATWQSTLGHVAARLRDFAENRRD